MIILKVTWGRGLGGTMCDLIIVPEHTKWEHTPRPVSDMHRAAMYYVNVAQAPYNYQRAYCPYRKSIWLHKDSKEYATELN